MSQPNAQANDGFELRTADGTSYLACLPLEREGFVAAFSTREGAVAGEPVDATAGRLAKALARPDARVVTCRQVHGADVRVVRTPADVGAPETECDAVTAMQRGLLLGIKTADCVPILLVDRKTRAVAAIHAGWRGTARRIAERAFATMVATWRTHRSDVFAAIGPAVCSDCYEVGPEVMATFGNEFPYSDRFLTDADGEKGHVDLKEANAIQLELCGIPLDHISVTDRCTICENERFFSFRAEGAKAGRILAVVGDAS